MQSSMRDCPLTHLAFMSRWRARYLDFRVWLGLLLFEQPPPRRDQMVWSNPLIVNIGFGQILKMNSSEVEIAAMWIVGSYLPIPVPRIQGVWLRWGSYWHKNKVLRHYVLMSRAKGLPLAEVWNQMSVANQNEIVSTLRSYVQTLREAEPPSGSEGRICSFTGGAMQDEGLTSFDPVGPFTQSEFVDYLLDTWYRDKEAKKASYRKILSSPKNITPVLTHGDLHPYNIIVDKETKTGKYKITAVIDWTTAGWLPMYWEAYKAKPIIPSFWDEVVEGFAGDFKEEVAVLREVHQVLR